NRGGTRKMMFSGVKGRLAPPKMSFMNEHISRLIMSQFKHIGSFIIKSGTATFSSGGLFNTMCPVIDHVKCVPGSWNVYSEGVLGRHLFCHDNIDVKNFDLNGVYTLLGRHKFDMWANTLRISDSFHMQQPI